MSCACNPFYPSIDRLEQGKRRMSTTVTIDPRFHDAVIFDLDGVVTDTASIHAAAWAALFNDFLQRRTISGTHSRQARSTARDEKMPRKYAKIQTLSNVTRS